MSLNIKTAVTPENPSGYIRVAGNAANVTTASNVIYTNTTSGLSAVTVQAAIDETVVKIKDIELFKFPNATIIGSPTINNGQISGFSNANYMRFPFIVNMQGRPFVITMAFITGTDVTAQQNILDGVDHGLAFAIRGGKFILVMGSTSGEWDITNGEKESSISVTASTSYMIRLSWTGSVYKFEYSTDGETYTEDETMRVTSSASLYPTQIFIGNSTDLTHPFVGIVNMNYSSLQIAGKIIWTGMDDVGLATRMAVDMSNIDDAGIEKINRVVMKDYDKPEELPEDEESIKETDEIKEAIGKLEYKVDSKGTAIPVYTKVTYAEAVARGEIKSGSQFIISDDYTDEYLTEVKDARTNSAVETPVTYADLKTRLDTDYADIMEVIDELPTPMVFKGTVGTGGTITTLPTAAASNTGFTYKVITDGVVEGTKKGDTVISTGTKWEIIPSGDEPSGTVTNVAMTVPTGLTVTGSPITTSGTIAVALDTGYEIPTSASLVKKVNNITPTNNNVTLAGNNIATKSTTYSKATSEADITYDTTVDAAIGQLDYRTDVLKQNKVDKTTVSSSISSSKCTIEAPEKAKAMSVCTMKGRTVKNIFDANADWYKKASSNTVTVSNETITITGTWFCSVSLTLKANTDYTLSGIISSSTVDGSIRVLNSDKTQTVSYLTSSGSKTFNSGSNTTVNLALYSGNATSGTSVYKSVQLEEGTSASGFVGYGSLGSAANESVVSVGRNIFDGKYNFHTLINGTSGSYISGSSDNTYSAIIKCKPSTTYDIYRDATNSNRLRVASYSVSPTNGTTCISGSLRSAYEGTGTNPIHYEYTTPSGAEYMVVYVSSESKQPKMTVKVKDDITESYVPYFKHTVEIPISLTSLDGYGCSLTKTDSTTITNVIDFENGIYTQPVGVMKLKDLTWKYRNDGTGYAPYFYTEFGTSVIKVNGTITNQQNVVMGKYPTVGRTSPTVFTDKTMCADGGSSGVSQIQIKDSSYTDAETFKKSLSGQILLYEKYTTETKDISDIIRPLKVESGGTVTFVNEHNIDCDTVVKYKKEV